MHYGGKNGPVSCVRGANIGGFVRVADATLAYGIVCTGGKYNRKERKGRKNRKCAPEIRR
jgi:hypothetical protein